MMHIDWYIKAVIIVIAVALSTVPAAARRVALVVGVETYDHARKLRNPASDARAVGAKLSRAEYGFQAPSVIVDPDTEAFRDAIGDFAHKAAGADLALFFFAGHGLQLDDTNYLLARDAKLGTSDDISVGAVSAQSIVDAVAREGGARRTIIILDACRDRPRGIEMAAATTRGALVVKPGLAPVAKDKLGLNTFLAFSTATGNVALDGEPGDHSPFTKALLRHLETPGQTIQQVIAAVRLELFEKTRIAQVPWENHSLLPERLVLRPGNEAEAAIPDIVVQDLAHWHRVRRSLQPGDFEEYMRAFASERMPEGRGGAFSVLAEARLRTLRADSKLPSGSVERAQIKPIERRMTALWVDDNPSNNTLAAREIVPLLAAHLDIRIAFKFVKSTEAALELLNRQPYDFVVSDMGRPGNDRAGYELLERIRLAGLPIPFIVYSSSRKPEHIQEASDRGAQGSTNHPVELLWLIARAVAAR